MASEQLPERARANISLNPSDFKPFKRKIKVDGKETEVLAVASPIVAKNLPVLINKLEAASSTEERLRVTKETCYILSLTEDYREARLAFRDKRLPNWQQGL